MKKEKNLKVFSKKKVKVALIQLICPHYRVPLFKKLAEKFNLVLFYGEGEKRGPRHNAGKIEGFVHKKLFSIALKFRIGDFSIFLVLFPTLLFHIHKYKPEIIISEGFTNIVNNVFIWFYCKLFSIPLIIWDSGRRKEKPMILLRKIVEPLNIFLLKQSKAVIAYGKIARDYFISVGVSPKKIFIAQNTIDIESCVSEAKKIKNYFSIIDIKRDLGLIDKKVVFYVGALEKYKKLEDLIIVFKEIEREVLNISLVIIGDGSYKDKLISLVNSTNIKNCIFLGEILEGVDKYFSAFDIFVLPGRGGLAINQAMAYGKPVIVGESDGTEVDLVKDGVNGFIIKDKNQLKQSILEVLKSEYVADSMGKESQNIIRKFTIKNMIEKFAEAIEYSYKD